MDIRKIKKLIELVEEAGIAGFDEIHRRLDVILSTENGGDPLEKRPFAEVGRVPVERGNCGRIRRRD